MRDVTGAPATLSAQDRELFLLNQIQEISAPELAKIYERKPDAIRAQQTRIRRKLRVELAEI